MIADASELGWLFAGAFASSTLLPGGSEALFAALLWQGASAPLALLAVAAAGNSLGGMTSWGIGRAVAWRFPAREPQKPAHRAALMRIKRFGSPALLFSWLPVIGDPLCVAAGWLGIAWWRALLFIGIGKTSRYAAILWTMT